MSSSDTWHILRGTNPPPSNWKTAEDTALNTNVWQIAPGGFGFADNTAETVDCGTILSDMENRYKTLYMRKTFSMPADASTNLHLMLSMDFDDGFIAWVDGTYLTNVYSPGAPAEPAYNASATSGHEASHGNSSPQPAMIFDLGSATAKLEPGPHILGIMGLNVSSGSSDFIQVANLYLQEPVTPPTNALSGTIAADRTLYATNSPYAIVADVTVLNGVTLTIEPGTTLEFGPGANLIVATTGRLLAEGTAEQPILFIRPQTNGPSWGHIVINGAVDSPENRIAHGFVEGNGATPCVDVSGGTVYLDHVSFGTTSRPYLALDDSSFVITDCYFPAATATFEPVHGTGGIKSGGHGIIQNCFFGAIQGYCDTIDFTGGNRPGPIVQFINNVFMGTGDDNLDLDSTDAWVQGNIFLHVHKNGSPDTSSGVSGGNDDGNNGDVTIIGNFFYDCDQAVMAKQGNFYTLINNTIVHQTHVGGLDTDGAVLCLQDNNMTEGRGMWLEGNIIYDTEKLTRNVTSGIVTFTNNLMPLAWSGPGGGNITNDPGLTHIPPLADTYFTNWPSAQVMKQWLKPASDSPALGSGPNGTDKGGAIPFGVSISGEPTNATSATGATLTVGVNRSGAGIPVSDWPNGAGYTHYRFRLDTNDWSAEMPISVPIVLTNLSAGPHHVDVIGRNDAGFYQNDPLYGPNARITSSRTWTVQGSLRITSIEASGQHVAITFPVSAGTSYSVQYTPSLAEAAPWLTLTNLPVQVSPGSVSVQDAISISGNRFYRVISP